MLKVLIFILIATPALMAQCGVLTVNPLTHKFDCTGPVSSATGTVTSVDGSAGNGVETIQGGVAAAITSAGTVRGNMPVRLVTTTTDTILTSDRGKLVSYNSVSNIAVTVPQSSSPNFPAGFYFCIQTRGTGLTTVTPTTSLLDGGSSIVMGQNQGMCIFADGTNYYTMRGLGGAFTFSSADGGLLQTNYDMRVGIDGRNPAKVVFGTTSQNGIYSVPNTEIYLVGGTNNSTALRCRGADLGVFDTGVCAIGATPSNAAQLQLIVPASHAFGAGFDGIPALVATSGAGSDRDAAKNGGAIVLTTGAGGSGATSNGNGGELTLGTGTAGGGGGTAGVKGAIVMKIGGTTRFTLDGSGHFVTAGTAPALTSCGSSPAISGNDHNGVITVGTGATGCVASFNIAYASAPSCVVTNRSGTVFSYTTSTTALTLTNGGDLSSTLLDYNCTQK